MLTAVVGTCSALSIAILAAHAIDAVRSRS